MVMLGHDEKHNRHFAITKENLLGFREVNLTYRYPNSRISQLNTCFYFKSLASVIINVLKAKTMVGGYFVT